MEFGPYQIQIFVSLALILGASLIALICDYLKGHNEQLREMALELKVRREEEHKLMDVLTAQNAHLGTAQLAAAAAAATQAAEERVKIHSSELVSPEALTTLPEPERALSRAAAPADRSVSLVARAMAVPAEQKRVVSAEALEVMQLGAMKAGATHHIVHTTVHTGAPEAVSRPEVSGPAEILQEVVAVAAAQSSARSSTPSLGTPGSGNSGPKKDWSSLLAAQRNHAVPEGRDTKPPAPPESGLLDAVMAATNPSAPEFQSPTGIQSTSVLNKLIAGRRPVSGLIVSIGVDAAEPNSPAVWSAIESLLQPGELAGPTGRDEFILLLPAERGASAQRRLSRISQQLWDFQLGSLSPEGVQFTWGGAEVREEPMDEAVASAVERMRDTRRGRQFLAAHGAEPASARSL